MGLCTKIALFIAYTYVDFKKIENKVFLFETKNL